jgi:N-acetylglutamate synthase-like GNAT family acetyltransferase
MIRIAEERDLAAVEALLGAAGLPTLGVAEHFGTFFVADDGGKVVGAAGLELYGTYALLRSVVVGAETRRAGLGSTLTRRALDEAIARGARVVYLLTTTAEAFFPRFGFVRVPREAVPEALAASHELRGACPASAVVMVRQLV